MSFKSIRNIAVIAVSSLFVLPVAGQDLLANQAPIDRKMKAVDAGILKHLVEVEEFESLADELYEDWDNTYAHRETELPDSFRIDLRDFCMPTASRVVTSNFGARWRRQHKGLDIKVYIGDTIRSAFPGKVRVVKNQGRRKGYGQYIVIRHPNGLETIYGHLSKQLVVENQEVRAGEPIGLGGNTGRSTGSHLHFETRLCGVALNPAIMFDFVNQDVVADSYMFYKNRYEADGMMATVLRGANGKNGYDPALVNSPNVGKSRDVASRSTSTIHKVRKGETLSSIARKHGTTVNALCRLNRISKNVRLRPGQILKYN
ncbi:MAG: peptidoglycan DD-metalloendopeptidase family protein [Prevotella sp.]|jgi:murein DD-endopeptidase MepM/ murein hydrolase activator NlpD|nr:peptidoglycan DD-metalloendopeptidase family protein [Prevotella sp.]